MKAMCDMSEARLKHLKTLYPEARGHRHQRFLSELDLDVVVIATPVTTHYPR
jgi:predicted dehydrogenase